MKTHTLLALICLSLLTPSLFGQTNAVATPPPVPEEARKHFVMGTALFKDAKTPDDYSQVVGEFKQAADLAPQWPDARYNLALAKEAAGDYSGAMADLKLYQQFKLSDDEARTVQDKIYVLEAKQEKKASAAAAKLAEENSPEAQLKKFIKSLDGAVWQEDKQYMSKDGASEFLSYDRNNRGVNDYDESFLEVHGHEMNEYILADNCNLEDPVVKLNPSMVNRRTDCWKTSFESRQFNVDSLMKDYLHWSGCKVKISDDGQSITFECSGPFYGANVIWHRREIYKRIK
jgi:tetratricopeptide (TPR) repeat protein